MSQGNPFESPAPGVDESTDRLLAAIAESPPRLVVRWREESSVLRTVVTLWFVLPALVCFHWPLVLVMRWFWGRWFQEAAQLSRDLGLTVKASAALVGPWEWVLAPFSWFSPFVAVRGLVQPEDEGLYSVWRIASIVARTSWYAAVAAFFYPHTGLADLPPPRGEIFHGKVLGVALWFLGLCLAGGGAGGAALAVIGRRVLQRQRERLRELFGDDSQWVAVRSSRRRGLPLAAGPPVMKPLS